MSMLNSYQDYKESYLSKWKINTLQLMRFLNDEYDNSVNKRYLVGKQLKIYQSKRSYWSYASLPLHWQKRIDFMINSLCFKPFVRIIFYIFWTVIQMKEQGIQNDKDLLVCIFCQLQLPIFGTGEERLKRCGKKNHYKKLSETNHFQRWN